MSILQHTPVWAWALLAGLLALGFWQSRPRRLAPAQILVLPAVLLLLGLSSLLSGLASQPAALVPWLAALAATAAWRRRQPPPAGAVWLPQAARLQLPGSWLPMLLIVCIFTLRYSAAVCLALNPAWRTAPGVMLPLAAIYGALSGIFLGRALSLLALTRKAPTASAAASTGASTAATVSTIGCHDPEPLR